MVDGESAGGGRSAAIPSLPAPPLILDPSSSRAVAKAVAALRDGLVAVIPTDTVYGVAAALDRPPALDRLFALKGRPASKPLPVLVSSPAHLGGLLADGDWQIVEFAAKFWPGALTLVAPARRGLPVQVVGHDAWGRRTVGVRLPALPLAVEIIDRCGGALAVTSANRSGENPACTGAEATAAIGPAVDVILDAGPCTGGVASTVVSINGTELDIVREGEISGVVLRVAWTKFRSRAVRSLRSDGVR